MKKSTLTASPRVGIFADNLISIGLSIRFPKMFVFENPPGGAWGVRLACSLTTYSAFLQPLKCGKLALKGQAIIVAGQESPFIIFRSKGNLHIF